jgi:DNA helicase HerA-like ATPase
MEEMVGCFGERFGVLAQSDTSLLTVIARNSDVAVGDLFLLPSRRGADRIYVFRTTHYANVLNRTLEVSDVARNKLTMPDSYLAEDLAEERLLELRGVVLGYAELDAGSGGWSFHRPRRLPEHLSDVYRVEQGNPAIAGALRELLGGQLGTSGLYVGDLLAGEQPLRQVPVYLPPSALCHHIGIFGRTGCGKSHLIMVLLRSVLQHNREVAGERREGPPASILAMDPHDEYRMWHSASGGAEGIRGLIEGYSAEERKALVEPFYYLSARDLGESPLERRIRLSRADLVPADLISTMEFSEQQAAFAGAQFGIYGERWITRTLLGETGPSDGHGHEEGAEYLPGTVGAVQRRLGFLRQGQTRVFTRFDPDLGLPYESDLPDIVCALERGRLLLLDTTLMNEMEQFLVATVVTRVLFALRRALRAAQDRDSLIREIRLGLGDDGQDAVGQRSLADELVARLERGELSYVEGDSIKAPDQLPFVNVVVEEAPSILNPERMRFGSVFRDVSRQGRKFGIGLTVISQQVSAIDSGLLTQINTELTMSLGNEMERREAIRNASADLAGFEKELQVMERGQALLSASYKDVPLPIAVPALPAPASAER